MLDRPSVLDYSLRGYLGLLSIPERLSLPAVALRISERRLSILLARQEWGPKAIAIMPRDRIRFGRSLPGVLPRVRYTTRVTHKVNAHSPAALATSSRWSERTQIGHTIHNITPPRAENARAARRCADGALPCQVPSSARRWA